LRPTATAPTARELPVADAHQVRGTRTGTIQAVSLDGLVRWHRTTRARSCSITESGTSSTRTARCWTSADRRHRRMRLGASRAWWHSGRSARSSRTLPLPSA
jgi:hypothetical protein